LKQTLTEVGIMLDLCYVSKRVVFVALFLFFAGDFTARAGDLQNGRASWYSTEECGYKTASGKPLDDDALTAAHKSLPMGSLVCVTNLETNRSVVVKIIDRGPYKRGRIIDLTRSAFSRIASCEKGIVRISIRVISLGKSKVVSGSGGV